MNFRGIAAVNSIIFLTVTTPPLLANVFVQDLVRVSDAAFRRCMRLTLPSAHPKISEREVYTREFHGARLTWGPRRQALVAI
jgi:hypothetical protein